MTSYNMAQSARLCSGTFRLDPALDHFLVHYAAQGWLASSDSEEGKQISTAGKVARPHAILAPWVLLSWAGMAEVTNVFL